MSLSRLLAVAACAAFLALAHPTHAAEGGEVFRSPTVGFELVKPAAWQFVTADQNAQNVQRTKVADEELQAALARYATTPLVVITKYAEPYDDLNPSLKVNVRPLGALKGAPPTRIVELLVPQLRRAFPDLVVADGPREVQVGGRAAGYVRVHFAMALPDGRTFPTASELWIVPRGEHFFMIGGGTRQDEATGTRAEVQSIVSSIRIKE